MFFSFAETGDFLSVYGVIHLVWISSFLLTFLFSMKLTDKAALFVITLYQFMTVFSLYIFYLPYYGDPFGPNPTDEIWYHSTALFIKDTSLIEGIKYILKQKGIGDIGFPLVMRYIYMIPGDSIFNMKIVNIIFHVLATILVYRTSKLLKVDKKTSKLLLILYGLNPISIYFNASGRKEALFVLVVAAAVYFGYKAHEKKRLSNYIIGFLLVLMTGLFRIPFPLMFMLGFITYYYLDAQGKYKQIYRIALVFLSPILVYSIWVFLQQEITNILSVDLIALASHRIGDSVPSVPEYVVMAVSGFIGPIPSFDYGTKEHAYLLQTVPNYIKMILSFPFLIGFIQIIKRKVVRYYPLAVFIVLNIVMLTLVAATLDFRYHYAFMPLYFLVIAKGIAENKHTSSTKLWIYIGIVITFIVSYNLR